MLVGTKADLRESPPDKVDLVPYEDGVAMAKEIEAVRYLECSAQTQQGLKEVFEACLDAVLGDEDDNSAPGGCCTIL